MAKGSREAYRKLILAAIAAAQLLGAAAPGLGVGAALLGRFAGPCRSAADGALGRLAQQRHQTGQGIGAILLTRAEAPRGDDDFAVLI